MGFLLNKFDHPTNKFQQKISATRPEFPQCAMTVSRPLPAVNSGKKRKKKMLLFVNPPKKKSVPSPWVFLEKYGNHFMERRTKKSKESLQEFQRLSFFVMPARWFNPWPFSSPNVGGHQQPLKGSRELTIPKRSLFAELPVLLLCSFFSGENDHLLLIICSWLSTARIGRFSPSHRDEHL